MMSEGLRQAKSGITYKLTCITLLCAYGSQKSHNPKRSNDAKVITFMLTGISHRFPLSRPTGMTICPVNYATWLAGTMKAINASRALKAIKVLFEMYKGSDQRILKYSSSNRHWYSEPTTFPWRRLSHHGKRAINIVYYWQIVTFAENDYPDCTRTFKVPFKPGDDIKESHFYKVDSLSIKFGVFRLRKYGAQFGLKVADDDYIRVGLHFCLYRSDSLLCHLS